MAIDWKGVFNRTPDALNKLVSIGLSIDQYKIQRDMQQSIWSGRCYYAPMGGGMYGGGYSGNTWDIIQSGMARMTDFTNRKLSELRNGGGTGCIGGGAGSGAGSSTVQATVDPAQGQNLARGNDTKFMNSSDWETLNNNTNRTSAEESTWKNLYKSGLTSLGQVFSQAIDSNGDGKIKRDEFIQYFKNIMKNEYQNSEIQQKAEAAWDNLNFNKDGDDSINADEMMGFLATLDEADALDGKITAKELKTGLKKIAEGEAKVEDKNKALNTTPPSSQPQTGNNPTGNNPTGNNPTGNPIAG